MDPLLVGAGTFVAVISYSQARKLHHKLAARKEEARLKKLAVSLTGISVSVYVRMPNGSRTVLERFLEQELISRGAAVLVANQEIGKNILKSGIFEPLSPNCDTSLVGTLVLTKHTRTIKKESEFEFKQRLAKFLAKHRDWKEHDQKYNVPEPVLQPRLTEDSLESWHTQDLSFQMIDSRGVVLWSGSVYVTCDDDVYSDNDQLKELAEKAFAELDESNIWKALSIDTITEDT